METQKVKPANPSPEERPDLYDDYDCSDRPLDAPSPVKMPDYIQKLIAERSQKKQRAPQGGEE
jgi:hypothetical protein